MTDAIPADHYQGYPVSGSTYKLGCVCGGCRSAHASEQRARIAKRAADTERDDDGHPIGKPYTSGTYVNYKCRCDRCRAEHNAASKRGIRHAYAAWQWVQVNRPDIAEQIRRETL